MKKIKIALAALIISISSCSTDDDATNENQMIDITQDVEGKKLITTVTILIFQSDGCRYESEIDINTNQSIWISATPYDCPIYGGNSDIDIMENDGSTD